MKKFFTQLFSFANDSDGFSLKDIVTLSVLVIWSVTIVIGLINDYSGAKLEQFGMVLDSATSLTSYVVLATLGLVATDSIASIFKKGSVKKTPSVNLTSKEDVVEEKEDDVSVEKDEKSEDKPKNYYDPV